MCLKWEVKETPRCLGLIHAEQSSEDMCVSHGAVQGPLVGGSEEHTVNFLLVLAASSWQWAKQGMSPPQIQSRFPLASYSSWAPGSG